MNSIKLSGLADKLNQQMASLAPQERLTALRQALPGRVVFTTSFGIEDQVITQLIASAGLDVAFATLDTGRLFPQTYTVWQETEARYGMRIEPFYPDARATEDLVRAQGINGFYNSVDARKACCGVRKVEPLARSLAGAQGWITGLRADQSDHRSGLEFVSFDVQRNLLKLSPIFDWSRDDCLRFTQEHAIPVNSLHGQGFLSIGCAPCTRAIAEGEPERAGRWWWEQDDKKECGLHFSADGKIIRPGASA